MYDITLIIKFKAKEIIMDNLETLVENYLEYCSTQKCLDEKTLKAYRIDLRQFSEQTFPHEVTEITSKTLEDYIAKLHQQYKPKTVKRKIASLKALFPDASSAIF